MMADLALWLLSYAVEHLLLCLIVAPVLYIAIRTGAIAPGKRAALLLLAFALIVVGPAIPLPAKQALASTTVSVSNPSWRLATESAAPATALAHPDRREQHDDMTVPPELAALLVALWLAGAAWGLARLLAAQIGARRVLAASHRSLALERAYRHAIPAGTHIHVSPSFGPAALGIVRPKIVLPDELAASLSIDALRAVLLHEASHIRRKDLPVLLMQRLVEALFWWNPIVRRMGAALDSAREIACDLRASQAYGASIDYAEALLASVEQLAPTKRQAQARALCAAASLGTLDQRIDAIIESPQPSRWTGQGTLLSVATALIVLWVVADIAAPRIALKHPIAESTPYAAPAMPALPSSAAAEAAATDPDALTALHAEYSQFLYASHDDYTQTLQNLMDAYGQELEALAQAAPQADSDARLARLNQRYGRMHSAAESKFRIATAQAQAKFLAAQKSLGYP
ncbi:M56 family metallopeptidase [Lysobacter sp. cf310]|uniref:M56 family metallopeptidase n=1 Tax=Lysobacter sp. cf310 TaxID=1761790 RepID=UPI0008E8C936|nr:M56 family metallopeptidase [Lysobacter sp. cf310]SFK53293.1 Signal transducer regulating beta-lactamase production, contains metallopeptidase domain [Lysobacter sp. cf310]